MNINPTGQAGMAAEAARQQRENAEAGFAATSDFQTFLTLLTSQLRNQDPLKPMESTEFVAQLASFSAVEQQVRTNDMLGRIFEVMGGGSSAGLAQWIGREVRAPAAASYQGVPVEVEFAADRSAERRSLVVKNAFDQVVARIPVEAGATQAVWDGMTSGGTQAPHGTYRFEAESYGQGGTLLDAKPGSVFAPVTEVRLENGTPLLVLAGGEKVALDAVTAVR